MKTVVIIKGKEAFPSGYVSLQTEQVLREGESHYKNLVEKIPAIIYTFSNLRGGLYYSAGVEAILGYEQHDLLENVWLWHDSIHLDDLVRVDKAVQDSLAGAAFELEYRIRDKLGAWHWFRDRFFEKTFMENEVLIDGLAIDITQIKENQLLLERYKALAENTSDSMWFARIADGQILEANLAACQTYGYTRAEFQQLTILNLSELDTHSQVSKQLKQANMEGILFETIHIRKSGEHFPVEVSSKGVNIGGERVLLSVIRDISERKRTDSKLLHHIETASRRTTELEALISISTTLRQAHTRLEMASLIVELSMQAIQAQGGALALLESNLLIFYSAQGTLSDWLGEKTDAATSIFKDVIDDHLPRFIEEQTDYSENIPLSTENNVPQRSKSYIILPLKNGDAVIGVLYFEYARFQPYSESLKRLVSAISEMSGTAIQRMSITETLEEMVISRSKVLENIYQVTSAASGTLNILNTLQHALELTLQASNTHIGAIFLWNESQKKISLTAHYGIPSQILSQLEHLTIENSLEGRIIQNKRALIITNLTFEPLTWRANQLGDNLCYTGLPMKFQDSVIGVLSIIHPREKELNLDELTLLSFIADHLALIIENARLSQQSEQKVILEERARLAREIHDSITQSMYSATLFSESAKEQALQKNYTQAIEYINRVGQITQQALREMRLMIYELRLPIIESGDLIGGLQNRLDSVERRSGLSVTLKAQDLPPLSPIVAENLYRIALEGLNNISKHASASQVLVELFSRDNLLSLIIQDDGIGFNLQEAVLKGGVGLSSIQERTNILGANLLIQSNPNSGTRIEVNLLIHPR